MFDIAMMKRKASGIRHKVIGRFSKMKYGEKSNERDVRPLLRFKQIKMTPWEQPEQLLTLNTKSKEGKNMMSNFAISGSAVIATTFSEDTHSTRSSHLSKDLYRQQHSPRDGSRIVHPVVCKRDMYVELQESDENSQVRKQATDMSRSSGRQDSFDDIMNDYQEDFRDTTNSLPSYSVAGSTIFSKKDEGGKIVPFTKSQLGTFMGPPQSSGVPPNTIMASMLFRNLEINSEKKTSRNVLDNDGEKDDEERENEFSYEKRVPHNIRKHREYEPSSVSSVTMYSSYQHDPVVRASNKLYNILRVKSLQQVNAETNDIGLFEA